MKNIVFVSFLIFQSAFCKGQKTSQSNGSSGNNNDDYITLKHLIEQSRLFMSASSKSHYYDSALVYAEKSEVLALKSRSKLIGDIYLLKAEIFALHSELEKGKIQAQKAIEYFKINGTKSKMAMGYIKLAENYAPYDTGLAKRIYLYENAAQIFQSQKDTINEALTLRHLAYTLMTDGKMDKALSKLKQCLSLYQAIGYKSTQDIYSLLCVVYTQKGAYTEALQYGLQAVKLVEQLKDSSQNAGEIYNYVSITYARLKQNNKVEEYLRKAFLIAEKGTNIDLILLLASNIAEILTMQNKAEEGLNFLMNVIERYPASPDRYTQLQLASRILNLALETKQYDRAKKYCAELEAMSAQFPPEAYDQLIVYPFLLRYYILTHKYDKARKYLEPYHKLVLDAGMLEGIREVNTFWYVLDSARGDYLSAIEHLKLARFYNDSLYSQTSAAEISALQVQYETEKKEHDIQLLTKQAQLQRTKLQQATFSKNVTLAGIAVTIFITGLLYNRYRLKQKSNYRLELQQKEINEKNSSLQQLLTEKEWLLKEIHHRTKNNLQTVISLLNSQSAYLHNDSAYSAIQDSKHRVQAMSLIHQKLYKSDNVSTIDMKAYIVELVEYLRDCFNTGQRIRFEISITPLVVDVSQAAPLGLILNEAITNAIKYAFPDDKAGFITINLAHDGNNQYTLTIADNGVGITADYMHVGSGSLGMSLMKGLAEDIEGIFTIENRNGTSIRVSFIHDTTVHKFKRSGT